MSRRQLVVLWVSIVLALASAAAFSTEYVTGRPADGLRLGLAILTVIFASLAFWAAENFTSDVKKIAGALVTATTIAFATTQFPQIPPGPDPPTCAHSAQNADDAMHGYHSVNPGDGAPGVDVTVCDVNVNNGDPIAGTYSLSGEVFGTVPAGKELSLLRVADSSTCDISGHPGTGDFFYVTQIDLKNGATAWSTRITLQSWEVTLRFNYYISVTPKDTKGIFDQSKASWQQKYARVDGWPGVENLAGAETLGTFNVQPPVQGKSACKAA
jgi:hypothetical protein